jgi:anti-sigma factor RsiW
MTSPFELTCQEIVELATEYLRHGLPAEQRARFEQHLFTCPPCTTYLEQMKTVVELAGALGEDPPVRPPPPAAVLEAFRRWKRP